MAEKTYDLGAIIRFIMKRVTLWIFVIGLGASLWSCQENDPLADLSKPGKFAPSILFLNLPATTANINTNMPCEVEYWSKDDEFQGLQMRKNVSILDNIRWELQDAIYEFRYEATTPIESLQEVPVSNYSHNFVNYVPERNAYVIRPNFLVPSEYARITRTPANTTMAAFVGLLSEEVKELFFTEITIRLTKNQLRNILVTVHEVVSEETFETYYNEAGTALTAAGREAVKGHLQSIGILNLMKDTNYQNQTTHRVALFFTVTNGEGVTARSVARAFNVN
jgi:hypothetical protein